MPQTDFKTRLKSLPLTQKFVLLGSILAMLGAFMPWYSDVDRFKTGDSFLGITGPMYLAGFFVLVGGLISLALILSKLMEKDLPKLPLKEAHIHIFTGGLSVLMLILAASVYFHPKFGVNLTDKNMGFGMMLDFMGVGLVILGGILALRTDKEIDFGGSGKIEPLIDIEREKRELDFNRNTTVGQAMDAYSKSPSGWGPVQESINNIKEEGEG